MEKPFEPIHDDSNSGRMDDKAVDSSTREERQIRSRIATFIASNTISRDELHDRHADAQRPKRLEFLREHVQVPHDFDSVGSEEIDQMFGKER